MKVSSVADIVLNGPRVISSSFVSSVSAMGPNSVFTASDLSANSCCPALNCGVPQTVLSKLCLKFVREVSIFSYIFYCSIPNWHIN